MGGRMPISFLRAFAWVGMLLGILLGFLLIGLALFHNTPALGDRSFGFNSSQDLLSAMFGALSIAGGIFWWSLFSTIAIIAEALLSIRDGD
jgi:hypothetical protein